MQTKINSLLPTQSTIGHFRFFQSILLTPIFLFAVSSHEIENWYLLGTLFFIITFTIFPASNGYKSFHDKDKNSIGTLENPLPVDGQLIYYAYMLEFFGLLLSWVYLGPTATVALAFYGVMSKLYSHTTIRIKSRPWASLFVVGSCQGGLIFLVTAYSISQVTPKASDLFMAFLSSCMIMAIYPLTQIYQHKEDASRGDLTLSLLLGTKGTFIFSSGLFLIMFALLALIRSFDSYVYTLIIFHIPFLIVFFKWMREVWKDPSSANFQKTHFCLKVLAISSNSSFFFLIIWRML